MAEARVEEAVGTAGVIPAADEGATHPAVVALVVEVEEAEEADRRRFQRLQYRI